MLLFSKSLPAGTNEGIPPEVGRAKEGRERPEEIGGSKILGFVKDGGEVGIGLLLECC